jgi:Domain of unknown function (DUF4920)
MLKKILTLVCLAAIFSHLACNKTAVSASGKKEISESEAFEKFNKQQNDGKHFGEAVTAKGAISYDAMLKKMSKNEKLDNVKVEGTVDAVCKVKGCWMNIKSDAGATPLFVQFKDYGFFMPKDIAGKKVVMVGKAYKEITTVEQLRHFAEDEGKSKEEIAKITKPVEEMKFLANGVLIMN